MNAKFRVSGLFVLFSLTTATLYAADERDAASESGERRITGMRTGIVPPLYVTLEMQN